MIINTFYPGMFELYCGPMKSGKTREMLNRVDKLRYMDNCKFLFLKPDTDTRDNLIKSRFGELSFDCLFVPNDRPEEVLRYIEQDHKMVLIDELQFFSKGIEKIIEKLQRKNINVIGSGLDLDFRGEPFGRMPQLLSIANYVKKLNAICEYSRCNNIATRTQRLIDGKPAPYDSPIILVGDQKEGYEPRCLEHHFVPLTCQDQR